MIKIENVEIIGWEAAIRGMRNPMNSWAKSDSKYCSEYDHHPIEGSCQYCPYDNICNKSEKAMQQMYLVESNDYDLMTRLRNAGTDHRKFMRMITVYLDITAPLYWWKEFKTYRAGRKFGDQEPDIIDPELLEMDIETNSCSTMHKIHEKKFTLEDFSCEHLYAGDDIDGMYYSATAEEEFTSNDVLKVVIEALNNYRKQYLIAKDKKDWWQMIQLLPSSYNQKRTVMLNYEVLANMYKSRKDHKLDEWREFCKWIESLPYSELITGVRQNLKETATDADQDTIRSAT